MGAAIGIGKERLLAIGNSCTVTEGVPVVSTIDEKGVIKIRYGQDMDKINTSYPGERFTQFEWVDDPIQRRRLK